MHKPYTKACLQGEIAPALEQKVEDWYLNYIQLYTWAVFLIL